MTFQMPWVCIGICETQLTILIRSFAAVAAWLNVFIRKADIVKIACIAQ